ncbi:hypothetical protein EV363DRAFT_1192874, partial [Boletus edulis]
PPQKKMKAKTGSDTTSAPHDPATEPSSVSANSVKGSQERIYNKDGYIIDVVKKRADYVNADLPVQVDSRWYRSFVPTATLWCSIQANTWNIPDDELVVALQTIFKAVYPEVKYRVVTNGSVFSVTSQRLSEWRSGFGSTALLMMIDFFSKLDEDVNIREAANYLGSEYRFLREDTDSLEQKGLYRSALLLELVARTHLLVTMSEFADIPGWDLRAVTAGKNGAGVIALAAAAGNIVVEDVLANWDANADSRNKIKLPKTTNPLTGRDSSGPYQFSAANWASDTAAYKQSIQKRGAAFIHDTFKAAQALKSTPSDGDNNAGASNPRALLCRPSFSYSTEFLLVADNCIRIAIDRLLMLFSPFPRLICFALPAVWSFHSRWCRLFCFVRLAPAF